MRSPSAYSYAFSLPSDPEEAFRLFSDPELLDKLTPTWFRLRPNAGYSLPLTSGAEISYRLRWRGLTLRWTSRIVEWEPPFLLTYEQTRGPYRVFRHQHRFDRQATGTRITDRVDYLTAWGRAVERFLIRPDLERIFLHRERAARQFLVAAALLEVGPGNPTPSRLEVERTVLR